MLLQQLTLRLQHCSRRQPCVPVQAPRTCTSTTRQQEISSPSVSCPSLQGAPQRSRIVPQAGRRGRPPAQPEEPSADIPDDDLFLNDDQFDYDEGEGGEFEEQLDPMSRKLIGLEEEDEEGAEDYGEDAAEEDNGILDEAAEADRDGAAADDVGEPSTSYPEPPERAYLAADLFGDSAIVDAALWLAANFPDVVVTGVQSNPHLVLPGEAFVLHPGLHPEDDIECIATAILGGASLLVAPYVEDQFGVGRGADPLAAPGLLPEHIPLVRVADPRTVGARIAATFYGQPSQNMVTIGVFGLVGKTTTTWLIRGILEELGQTVGLMSSIEHSIAEDRLDEDGDLWEPFEEDPSAERESSVPFKLIPYAGKYQQIYGENLPGLNTQKVLAGMCDRGAGVAVMEVGPQNLAVGTFTAVHINVAVVTNLCSRPGQSSGAQQQQSAEYMAAVLGMAEQVMQLLQSRLVDPEKQALVVNLDDPLSGELLRRLNGIVPVVTYSADGKAADVLAESVKSNIWETEVIVKTPNGRLQIITNLLGRHNVANVLAAVATGVALKAQLTQIVAGIEAVEIPGRSEVIDEGQEFSVVVDAARTPETLGAMLDALRQGGARQIFTVFGCSGEEDPSVRPKMGAVAHAKSDYVIVTNENPRFEDPAKIVADIVAGFPDDIVNRYSAYAYFPFQDQGHTPLWFEPYLQKAQRDNKRYIMEDRYSAIRAAIGTAGPEDVVLLAGKGEQDWVEHEGEDGLILTGWLDDRVEARNALSKLKYLQQIPKFDRETLPWGSKIETLMESLTVDAGILSRPSTTDVGIE